MKAKQNFEIFMLDLVDQIVKKKSMEIREQRVAKLQQLVSHKGCFDRKTRYINNLIESDMKTLGRGKTANLIMLQEMRAHI